MNDKPILAVLVVLLLCCLGSPTGLDAQNLLANPDFDDGIAGWTAAADGDIAWDELTDIVGDPNSGSMVITQLSGGSNAGIAESECVEVVPDREYIFGGYFLVASGQSGTSHVLVGLSLFDDARCLGTPLTSPSSTNTAIEDTWFSKVISSVLPSDAHSAMLHANVFNGNTDEFVVHSDHFVIEPALIFADGFESGDTTEWSFSTG